MRVQRWWERCSDSCAVLLIGLYDRGMGTWLEVKVGSGKSRSSLEWEFVPLYTGCELTAQLGEVGFGNTY